MGNESVCVKTDDGQCKYASLAAKEAVRDVFAILGVNIDEPAEVEEFRKSLRFGDSMRKAADKGLLAIVVVITGMGVAAIFAGFGLKIKTGVP